MGLEWVLRALGVLAAGAAAGVSLWTVGPELARAAPVAGAFLQAPAAAVQAVETMAGAEQGEQALTVAVPAEVPAPAPAPETPLPESTPAPAAPAATPEPVPEDDWDGTIPEGMGPVLEQHYGQGEGERYIPTGAATIKNCTALSAGEIAAEISRGMPFAIEVNSAEPQVLLMHTHATESYLTESAHWYDPAWGGRTTEPAANMCAVGEAMAAALNAAGVNTLHDTTLHDYPSYNGSYEKSNATVRRYLEQYPSIRVVIDVHRDAIEKEGAVVAPVAGIEGEKAAQVMLICGCDKNGNLPNFRQNLRFAAAWQERMETLYPGLTRPVLFDYRYYNQDLTTGSLLIEVGGHGNTLQEAVTSGRLAGQALAALLTGQ